MKNEIHEILEEKMQKTVEVLKSDFAVIRTGKASTKVLDKIFVEYYGALTPLNQLAAISQPEPRTLMIKPFDATILEGIEKTIAVSSLGINPNNDGEKIILNFPMLTQEKRKELSKIVKNNSESAKVALRNERREANDHLKKMEKKSEITEDDLKRALESVDKIIHEYTKVIEDLTADKVNEVLEI